MATEGEHKNLSPVSRRAFLRSIGMATAGAVVVPVAALMVGCPTSYYGGYYGGYSESAYGNCGYCNGYGRNYYHCDGNYCNYLNYGDA